MSSNGNVRLLIFIGVDECSPTVNIFCILIFSINLWKLLKTKLYLASVAKIIWRKNKNFDFIIVFCVPNTAT